MPVRLAIPNYLPGLARLDSPDCEVDSCGGQDVDDLACCRCESDHRKDPGPKMFEQKRYRLTELRHADRGGCACRDGYL